MYRLLYVMHDEHDGMSVINETSCGDTHSSMEERHL